MILVKFKFFNLPFERGKILFSKGFFDFTDICKLREKVKTLYTGIILNEFVCR